ncbi:hypothetical protein OpiT1DRAFT_04404 [Opitutaceae bacterium TAV1]|nr:hypothetical protein OpiT1DRAFT_04404 [Opitutaceae bacterium TAV1]
MFPYPLPARLASAVLASLLVTFIATAKAATVIDPEPPLPADNPYAAAISLWKALPKETREKLSNGESPVDSQATFTLDAISQALRTGADAPTVNWGLKIDQLTPWNVVVPYVGPMGEISRVALAQADRLVGTNPQSAVTLAADVLAAGRHTGAGNLLIDRLTQTAITQRATEWIGRRLPELSPEAVSTLRQRIATLPAGGDWATCLVNSKILPEALLNELCRAVALAPAAESDRTARNLRMAGMLVEGDTVSISLESPAGNFWIRPGKTRHGIRLVSVDLDHRQALLTYEGRLVQLHLTERKFVDLDTIRIRDAVRQLPDGHPLRIFFTSPDEGDDTPGPLDTLAQWVAVIDEVTGYYDAVAPNFENFDFADTKARYERLGPYAKVLTMEMTPLLQTAAREKILQTQLAAALDAASTGHPPSGVTDPVTEKPLQIILTRGGYILESGFTDHRKRPTRLVIGPKPAD